MKRLAIYVSLKFTGVVLVEISLVVAIHVWHTYIHLYIRMYICIPYTCYMAKLKAVCMVMEVNMLH